MGAIGGLVVFGLPMLIIAFIIRRSSRGPALYRSQRVGLHGELFELLKFRTMVQDADQVGPSSTTAEDPRITPIGHLLRRWKLDELPQFLNVLRGEMSLVGPRPQVKWAVDRYDERERRLLTIRPGITDWASIRFRDEAGILAGHPDADAAYLELIEPEKLRLGLKYVDEQSLITDLRIIWLTIKSVFTKDGIEL
ncbi:MAG: sugar transferase [Acidimicrobiia bacterium]|nr:sugar transferase [Acidimicrobiia bacterium]